jgi:hypothetical protein
MGTFYGMFRQNPFPERVQGGSSVVENAGNFDEMKA